MASYYVVCHLAPTMSKSGTPKHVREAQILNNLQDFLQELEGKQELGDKSVFVETHLYEGCKCAMAKHSYTLIYLIFYYCAWFTVHAYTLLFFVLPPST